MVGGLSFDFGSFLGSIITLLSAWILTHWQIKKSKDQEREFYILREDDALSQRLLEKLWKIDALRDQDYFLFLESVADFVNENIMIKVMVFNKEDKEFIKALGLNEKTSLLAAELGRFKNSRGDKGFEGLDQGIDDEKIKKVTKRIENSYEAVFLSSYLLKNYIQDRLSNEKGLMEKYKKDLECLQSFLKSVGLGYACTILSFESTVLD